MDVPDAASVRRPRHFDPQALPVLFAYHDAHGTREALPTAACLDPARGGSSAASCTGSLGFRLFARETGAAWDTTTVPDGLYRLRVSAWDAAGNHATAGVTVTVRNSPR
jgi:hypothetical protein